ncbi:MAG TPA: response regulator transcription factor, partial [Candidatus Paceibacterota bacterium]|nr:response regulator transcription factor [Candidatus Paceibacterota bacterium]
NTMVSGRVDEAGVRSGEGRRAVIDVWLVDDSANFRELLSSLLEEDGGIRCARQFSSAEAVLAALEQETPPDAILLDNRMPGMHGVDAVAPIVALAPTTHVLMLTTMSDSLIKARALKDGATDFLLKSLEVVNIADRIRQVSAMPRRSVAIPTVATNTNTENFRPDRRASELGVGIEHNPGSQPDIGRRSAARTMSQSRLMRGVNFLRSWLGQVSPRRDGEPDGTVKQLLPLGTPQ